MNAHAPIIRTQDHSHRPATMRSSVWAGAAVAVVLLVTAGCGDDAGAPGAPPSVAPPTATTPAISGGGGVPLEPGSNMPPDESDSNTIATNETPST